MYLKVKQIIESLDYGELIDHEQLFVEFLFTAKQNSAIQDLIKDSRRNSNQQTLRLISDSNVACRILHFDSIANGFLRFVKSYDKQAYIENSEFILQILALLDQQRPA
jgi:hypothetical protein